MYCKKHDTNLLLKNGDVVFRANNETGLSEAINKVTQTNSKTNYTHMGICQIKNDTVWVIHASAKNGVCKEPLMLFCKPNLNTEYVTDVYRLNQKYSKTIQSALAIAFSLLGEPYDSTYILDNKGYYCSEFIYEIFKNDSIFNVNPMTFIDPNTGHFHKEWVEHYRNLKIEIPEGKLGCNPNKMSTNGKLSFIKRL